MPKPKRASVLCAGCGRRASEGGDDQLYVFREQYWHRECGGFDVCSYCSEPVETEWEVLPTGERVCLECYDLLAGSTAHTPGEWGEGQTGWEMGHE